MTKIRLTKMATTNAMAANHAKTKVRSLVPAEALRFLRAILTDTPS
jgi:hypothetical protein